MSSIDLGGIIASFPDATPTCAAHGKATLLRVKEIVERGNVAVFTRKHRILSHVTVIKKVTNPVPDANGDLESDNGWVAPWDEAYTLTEETPQP